MASCLLEEKKKKSCGEEWRQKVVHTQSGPFLLLFFFVPHSLPPSGSLALLFLCGGTAERVSVLSLLRQLVAKRRSGRRHPHVPAERTLRLSGRREKRSSQGYLTQMESRIHKNNNKKLKHLHFTALVVVGIFLGPMQITKSKNIQCWSKRVVEVLGAFLF